MKNENPESSIQIGLVEVEHFRKIQYPVLGLFFAMVSIFLIRIEMSRILGQKIWLNVSFLLKSEIFVLYSYVHIFLFCKP